MVTFILDKVMLFVDEIFRYSLGAKYDKRPMCQDALMNRLKIRTGTNCQLMQMAVVMIVCFFNLQTIKRVMDK